MMYGLIHHIVLLASAHFATGEATCGPGLTCDTGLPTASASSGDVQEILQIVFAVISALAVLFIVVAGLRFVTAQGNPQETAKARSTIVYALAGLAVALSAEAIVSFVLGKL